MLLEGLHIPLSTPFHQDGRLNPYKLAANVIRYSKSPAAGLIALAPNAGEPTLLSDDETERALRAVAEAAAPEKVLLACTSRDSVRGTLALCDSAAELGFDAVVLAAPASAMSRAEVLTYFQAVADRSPLPVVVFATGRGRHALEPAIIVSLRAHRNVLGAIWNDPGHESNAAPQPARIASTLSALTGVQREVAVTPTFAAVTRRMQRLATEAAQSAEALQGGKITGSGLISASALAHNPAAAATALAEPVAAVPLKTRTKKLGFQLIAATPGQLLPDLGSGAVGIAPALAACAPQACYEVFAAWKDGDAALAREKQDRIQPAAEYVDAFGAGALKFGCDLNGYCGGLPRLPHLPLTAEQRSELQRRMSSLRT